MLYIISSIGEKLRSFATEGRETSVFIALWSTKMMWAIRLAVSVQVVIIYSFMKEIKLYIYASYFVFLFIKSENNNCIWQRRTLTNHVVASGLRFDAVSVWAIFDSYGYRKMSQLRAAWKQTCASTFSQFNVASKWSCKRN